MRPSTVPPVRNSTNSALARHKINIRTMDDYKKLLYQFMSFLDGIPYSPTDDTITFSVERLASITADISICSDRFLCSDFGLIIPLSIMRMLFTTARQFAAGRNNTRRRRRPTSKMKLQNLLLFRCLLLTVPVTVTAIHERHLVLSKNNGRRFDLPRHDDRNNSPSTFTASPLPLDAYESSDTEQRDRRRRRQPFTSVTSSIAASSIYQTNRGGACSDSTPRLFAKIALGATVETSLMYALVNLVVTLKSNNSNKYSSNSTVVAIVQTIVLLAVIFGSSTFGAIVDRGLSAATKQILDPNRIPVSTSSRRPFS